MSADEEKSKKKLRQRASHAARLAAWKRRERFEREMLADWRHAMERAA